jgi:ligand-binding sensor domain-containing protein
MPKSNINDIAQGITKNTEFEKNGIEDNYKYGEIVVENYNNSKAIIIKKDNITIVIGENIEICNSDKSLKVDGELNIEVIGNVSISSNQNVIIKSPDGSLWLPNTMPVCPFSGQDHSIIQTIKGENA